MTNLTYYGHACFSVEVLGKKLLFDPFITPNPLASEIDPASIEADYVLISHGHEDHLADAVDILKRTGAVLISNYEVVSWFAGQGCDHAHPLNHGGSVGLPFEKVKYGAENLETPVPKAGRCGQSPARVQRRGWQSGTRF